MNEYKFLTNEELLKEGIETVDNFDRDGFYSDYDGLFFCFDKDFKFHNESSHEIGGVGLGIAYTGFLYQTYSIPNSDFGLEYDDEDEYFEIDKNEGNLWYYSYLVDGLSIGDSVLFYQNGNVKCIESHDSDGSTYGRHFEWFENGVLHIEGYKIGGTLCLYRKYDEKGKLIAEKTKLPEEEIIPNKKK